MKFFKYHGTGNDFIIFDREEILSQITPELVRFLCHRNFGIGADGILIFEESSDGLPFMRIINSDGTEAEMCGNGIRCFVKYLFEHKGFKHNPLNVQTKAGIKECKFILDNEDKVRSVSVKMGKPLFNKEDIQIKGNGDALDIDIEIDGVPLKGHGVSIGNPHFVLFVRENPKFIKSDLAQMRNFGEKISNYKIFPNRTNVEFVKIKSKRELIVTVIERGAGLTLSCGTGACAAVSVSARKGYTQTGTPVIVRLPGGFLEIKVLKEFSEIELTGPAVEVFKGEIYL